MDYKVLGINSGLGVSLFPFKKNLIGNVEMRGIFHTPGNEQWKANFGLIPLRRDTTFFLLEKPDVIISSPDCGSGSVFRFSRSKELGDHKNNKSLAMFFENINYYKPKFFLFENLNGLFKSFPETDFAELLKDYRLIKHLESVSKWGNSQKSRKRLVIVGVRRDQPKVMDKIFRKLPEQVPLLRCWELYGDLGLADRSIGHLREPIDTSISIHAKKKMTLEEIRQHWKTRLKGKKRWVTEPGFNFTTAPGVYRNLNHDYPATARKANRQFAQDGLTLTPRQLARIQGIPDSFKIYIGPDDNKIGYWINKGRTVCTKTPPYEIGLWFKKCLIKIQKRYDR